MEPRLTRAPDSGRLLSVNVGRPQPIDFEGRTGASSIRKRPVQGPVAVHSEDLEGNEQADRRHHMW